MDPSGLVIQVSHLERSLDSLNNCLKVATGAVVIGLLVEYPYEIYEAICEFKNRLLKPSLTIAGAILITLGVAGELVIQSKESIVEGNLRSANHEVQAGLEKEASQAQEKAKQATAASLGAEVRIALARKAAAEADERAAKAGSIAEAERLERIKLQAAVAPRSLDPEQQREVIAECREFRGHNAIVYSYAMDGEGAAIGGQLISVLDAAGVRTFDARSSMGVAGGFEQGIHIRGPQVEDQFIKTLDHSLRSIGKLQVSVNDPPARVGMMFGGGGPAIPPGTVLVTIMVGIKPVPVLHAPK